MKKVPEIVERGHDKQSEHDRVIDAVVIEYEEKYPYVFMNPGERKNARISGYEDSYHDILVLDSEKVLVLLEEVETEETVNEEHVKDQWIPYSKINALIYLCVPVSHRDKALEISTRLNVQR